MHYQHPKFCEVEVQIINLIGHSTLNVNNYRITVPSIKFVFLWWRQKKALLQTQANAVLHILYC